MRALALVLLCACGSKEPTVPAEERSNALEVATQCTDAVKNLAPSYQAIGPKLSSALAMNRDEARTLLRDSIELLISTRELLCNLATGTLQSTLAKAPNDAALKHATTETSAASAKLAAVRETYDKLLGAASSATAAPNEAELLDRMTKALSTQ